MASGFIPAVVGGGTPVVSGGPQPVKANPPLPGTQGGMLNGNTVTLPMGSAPPKQVVSQAPMMETSTEGTVPTGQ